MAVQANENKNGRLLRISARAADCDIVRGAVDPEPFFEQTFPVVPNGNGVIGVVTYGSVVSGAFTGLQDTLSGDIRSQTREMVQSLIKAKGANFSELIKRDPKRGIRLLKSFLLLPREEEEGKDTSAIRGRFAAVLEKDLERLEAGRMSNNSVFFDIIKTSFNGGVSAFLRSVADNGGISCNNDASVEAYGGRAKRLLSANADTMNGIELSGLKVEPETSPTPKEYATYFASEALKDEGLRGTFFRNPIVATLAMQLHLSSRGTRDSSSAAIHMKFAIDEALSGMLRSDSIFISMAGLRGPQTNLMPYFARLI